MSFDQWNHPPAKPTIGEEVRKLHSRTCIGCGQDYILRWKPDELCQLPDSWVLDNLGLDYVGEVYACAECVEEMGINLG